MFITSFEEQNITYRSCSNFLIHLYPPFFIDARKQEHVLLMIESLIAALEVNLKATN